MIYGKRIRLRAIEREDLPDFVEWLNDPEVIAGLMIYWPLSLAEETQWFEKMLERPMEEHPLTIEIRDGIGWKKIGNIGLHNIDQVNRSSEIGIVIGDKSVWDQGYGSEAMILMLDFCFNTLNLNRIFLRVYEDNARAIRTYEKVGFLHEGRLRQARFANGSYHDILFMGVLRSEWSNYI